MMRKRVQFSLSSEQEERERELGRARQFVQDKLSKTQKRQQLLVLAAQKRAELAKELESNNNITPPSFIVLLSCAISLLGIVLAKITL